MLQKTWVRMVIWILATFFFFLGSMVLVSELKPGPSEQEVMLYMQGMMRAMESSLMGIAMSLEGDSYLAKTLIFASQLLIPSVVIGLLGGLLIRFLRWSSNNDKK